MLTPVLNSEPYTKLAENILKINESPRRTRVLVLRRPVKHLEENTKDKLLYIDLAKKFWPKHQGIEKKNKSTG